MRLALVCQLALWCTSSVWPFPGVGAATYTQRVLDGFLIPKNRSYFSGETGTSCTCRARCYLDRRCMAWSTVSTGDMLDCRLSFSHLSNVSLESNSIAMYGYREEIGTISSTDHQVPNMSTESSTSSSETTTVTPFSRTPPSTSESATSAAGTARLPATTLSTQQTSSTVSVTTTLPATTLSSQKTSSSVLVTATTPTTTEMTSTSPETTSESSTTYVPNKQYNNMILVHGDGCDDAQQDLLIAIAFDHEDMSLEKIEHVLCIRYSNMSLSDCGTTTNGYCAENCAWTSIFKNSDNQLEITCRRVPSPFGACTVMNVSTVWNNSVVIVESKWKFWFECPIDYVAVGFTWEETENDSKKWRIQNVTCCQMPQSYKGPVSSSG